MTEFIKLCTVGRPSITGGLFPTIIVMFAQCFSGFCVPGNRFENISHLGIGWGKYAICTPAAWRAFAIAVDASRSCRLPLGEPVTPTPINGCNDNPQPMPKYPLTSIPALSSVDAITRANVIFSNLVHSSPSKINRSTAIPLNLDSFPSMISRCFSDMVLLPRLLSSLIRASFSCSADNCASAASLLRMAVISPVTADILTVEISSPANPKINIRADAAPICFVSSGDFTHFVSSIRDSPTTPTNTKPVEMYPTQSQQRSNDPNTEIADMLRKHLHRRRIFMKVLIVMALVVISLHLALFLHNSEPRL